MNYTYHKSNLYYSYSDFKSVYVCLIEFEATKNTNSKW